LSVIFIPMAMEVTLSKMFLKYDFGVMGSRNYRTSIIESRAACGFARIVRRKSASPASGRYAIKTTSRARRLPIFDDRSMRDALLDRSIHFTIVATIAIVVMTSLILCYQALFEVIGSDFRAAGMKLGWGAACVIASLLLIRYRGDLVED
jgi:hypothetical protein